MPTAALLAGGAWPRQYASSRTRRAGDWRLLLSGARPSDDRSDEVAGEAEVAHPQRTSSTSRCGSLGFVHSAPHDYCHVRGGLRATGSERTAGEWFMTVRDCVRERGCETASED